MKTVTIVLYEERVYRFNCALSDEDIEKVKNDDLAPLDRFLSDKHIIEGNSVLESIDVIEG